MNTTENNKLIAEFMGYELSTIEGLMVAPKKQYTVSLELFQLSWDWLMPVVEKIWRLIGNRESLWYFDVSELSGEELNVIRNNREYDGDNKADCYSAVVEFIKWYNENK